MLWSSSCCHNSNNCLFANHQQVVASPLPHGTWGSAAFVQFGGWRGKVWIASNVCWNASNATTLTCSHQLWHAQALPHNRVGRCTEVIFELQQPASPGHRLVYCDQTCFPHTIPGVLACHRVHAEGKRVAVVEDTQTGNSQAGHAALYGGRIMPGVPEPTNCDLWNGSFTRQHFESVMTFFLSHHDFVHAVLLLIVILFSWHQEWNATHHACCCCRYSASNIESDLVRAPGFVDGSWEREECGLCLVLEGKVLPKLYSTKTKKHPFNTWDESKCSTGWIQSHLQWAAPGWGAQTWSQITDQLHEPSCLVQQCLQSALEQEVRNKPRRNQTWQRKQKVRCSWSLKDRGCCWFQSSGRRTGTSRGGWFWGGQQLVQRTDGPLSMPRTLYQ